ncbi:DNA-deoxyinosine glycosylase [Brevundimonas naejangsanensis]|uniref:DNA-deoxyinosine glycosylase n=1 Tax=Brevundimonas naejangsanensis TaxID=588932 RepID=A0A494RFP6_9CAUL|nr:DNA-deoxyinosine glycosylase [Brevundimonas naejangsanensis]AYG95247.1 DNA-deoxyinosine glycosylase [Brevundimonas naejangsanensis]
MTTARRTGFAPVVDDRTQLLILGSLPGDASLKAAQYYAHPQNGFWRLTGAVIGTDLPALPYETRLERLLAAGIGLWDVIASAERRGSLDAAIRNPEGADLAALVDCLPRLNAVAFNGATAARLGRRALSGDRKIAFLDLPSSSPAHARPFEEKLSRWTAIAPHLG